MPVISKQNSAKPVTKRPTGAAAKLKGLGDLSSTYGIRMVLYGRSKTGKTTLACTFPKPVLLIGTMGTIEDGTKSVSDISQRDGQFFPLEQTGEIDELVPTIREEGFQTVILDTGGGLQDMVLREVLGIEDVPVQKTWGTADQRTWGIVGAQTKERLRQLLSLSMSDGINVVVVAHERTFGGGDDGAASELIAPTVGAALIPSVTGWLNQACDYICQTFIRSEVSQETQSVAGKSVKIQRKTGRQEYCLRIGVHEVYQTGFRVPRGTTLPDVIVDPSYDKIRKLIQGGK